MTEGILLVDKPATLSSFALVHAARKRLGVKKIGHGGTLDPFATGLVVLLVGRNFTKQASYLLNGDKEYLAKLKLGSRTDSFDVDGQVLAESDKVPTLDEVKEALSCFQGQILQIPPMFSAKKIGGKRLYEYARKGITLERQAVPVSISIELVSYTYPELDIRVFCSKGTYIRSLAEDIGQKLGSYAHLIALRRTRSGPFLLKDAIDYACLQNATLPITLLGALDAASLST